MTKIDELVEHFNEIQRQFAESMKTEMKTLFKAFLEDNPTIKLIKWRQYTPFFNDGEECIFNVHDMYFILQNEELEDFSSDDDMHGSGTYVEVNGKWEKTTIPEEVPFDKFRKAIGKIPDDIFKGTFGDHCQITATREGFEVEEYEHE